MIDVTQSGFQFPQQWQQASDIYANMGNMMSPMWQAMQQQAQYGISDAVKQAVEQAGLGGMRRSTSLGQQAADIGAKGMASIMPQYWQQGLGAMGTAAGGLAGLGQQYANLPLNVASTMMGLAGQQQGMNMQAYQPQLQNFMWQQPSQYLPYASQFAGMQNYQQPQMYQPSPFTNMLQGGLAGFGLANQLGWNPFGGGSASPYTTGYQWPSQPGLFGG